MSVPKISLILAALVVVSGIVVYAPNAVHADSTLTMICYEPNGSFPFPLTLTLPTDQATLLISENLAVAGACSTSSSSVSSTSSESTSNASTSSTSSSSSSTSSESSSSISTSSSSDNSLVTICLHLPGMTPTSIEVTQSIADALIAEGLADPDQCSNESTSSSSSVSSSSSTSSSSSENSSATSASSSSGGSGGENSSNGTGTGGSGGQTTGVTSPENGEGAGEYRGDRTNMLGAATQFLVTLYSNAIQQGSNGIAPGAFGGEMTPGEHDFICAVQRTLPANPDISLLQFEASLITQLLGLSSSTTAESAIYQALQDPAFCMPPAPANQTSASLPIAFPVDAAGVPVSSDQVWNDCIAGRELTLEEIRTNPDTDSYGRGLDCASYHQDSEWIQPDLHITFNWDSKTKQLTLPPGYSVTTSTVTTQ